MASRKLKKKKVYTLEEVTDHYIGKRGTAAREQFEFELKLSQVGDGIRYLRRQRRMTQEDLGDLIGVQKAQISKLESNSGNITLETVLRVFSALGVDVSFKFDMR
jgi:HTH-type transcriptional regulator / antitoxin HipB